MFRPVHALLLHRSRRIQPVAATPVSSQDNAHVTVYQHKVIRIYGNVFAADLVIGRRIPVRPFAGVQCHKTDEFRLVPVTDMADNLRFGQPVRPVVAEQIRTVGKRMTYVFPQVHHRITGIIDHGYRHDFHAFAEFGLLLAAQRSAELGAASVNEPLVPDRHFPETAFGTAHRQSLADFQRFARFAEKDIVHPEIAHEIDVRARLAVTAGLRFVAAPIFRPPNQVESNAII